MTDIVIIGAGTAGMTAAIYAARAGKEALVLEQEGFGGQILYAPQVENYPGITQISGAEFASNLTEQALALGAQLEKALRAKAENAVDVKHQQEGNLRLFPQAFDQIENINQFRPIL